MTLPGWGRARMGFAGAKPDESSCRLRPGGAGAAYRRRPSTPFAQARRGPRSCDSKEATPQPRQKRARLGCRGFGILFALSPNAGTSYS